MLRALARLLLSAVFLANSTSVIKNAQHMTGAAESLGLPEPLRMVQAHGAVNLVAGLMLALGIKPKLAAWSLIANTTLTTFGAHRYWEEDDEGARMGQTIHFQKNTAIVGGLLGVIAAERAAARARAQG